jgi:precorrin-2 dehydrogenase/sirohydrochlorin ferrochelatase
MSTEAFPQYPVNLRLTGVQCLVVGGGEVAARKTRGLLECGAYVTVVSPTIVDELRDDPRVRWHQREYRRGEVASYRVAITATGTPSVDAQVYEDAKATGIPVNAADDPAHCTFTLPAVLRRGDLQIAISTNGRSPAFATWLKKTLASQITADALDAFDLVGEVRRELRRAGRPTEHPGWQRAFDEGLVDLVAKGQHAEARVMLLQFLDAADLLGDDVVIDPTRVAVHSNGASVQ